MQRQIDEQEQQSLCCDRERFLLSAVDNYIKCFQHHDKYDLRVFRLISLWFDNVDKASSDKISACMKVCMTCCAATESLLAAFVIACYSHRDVWICRLLFLCVLLFVCLFVCLFVRLRIFPLRTKLAASNFARWIVGVQGMESHIFVNLAPPEAQNRPAN